jgi:hypothetical protein
MRDNYFKDVFYIMALSLVVLGGCATPLGKFNKQEKVVENIQQEKDNNDTKQGALQIKPCRKTQIHPRNLK